MVLRERALVIFNFIVVSGGPKLRQKIRHGRIKIILHGRLGWGKVLPNEVKVAVKIVLKNHIL